MSTKTSQDIERDALFGGLFQQIMNEMKNSAPLWEDLTIKSTKLHSCLRATIQAIGAFLEAFQKIADAATSAKGATKDLGTALTRICLRHKAVEAKMKTFTSSILDSLIIPLQERLEEWKKTTLNLDKDHAKEYKKSRSELKKRTIETMRLQKKLRKGSSFSGRTFGPSGDHEGIYGTISGNSHFHADGGSSGKDIGQVVETALKDLAQKRHVFEEGEKNAIRTAMIEERSRFCLFVSYLKPVVVEELSLFSEFTHVQDALQQLEKHYMDPFSLPPTSEQVITDLVNTCDSTRWTFHTPPSSPSSLGSRKSSMCSISSVNSSSSSSGPGHSPSHAYPGTLRQLSNQSSEYQEGENGLGVRGVTPPCSTVTWPNLQDSLQFERAACAIMNERPHTISSAYEKSHQRPHLTSYTFQRPLDSLSLYGRIPSSVPESETSSGQGSAYQSTSEIYGTAMKPPVPKRCSSLERPNSVVSSRSSLQEVKGSRGSSKKEARSKSTIPTTSSSSPVLPDFNKSSADMIVPQPLYVNMHELNQLASARYSTINRQHAQQGQGDVIYAPKDTSSLASSGYGSQSQIMMTDEMAFGESGMMTQMTESYFEENSRYSYMNAQSIGNGSQDKPLPPARRSSSMSISSMTSQGQGQSEYHSHYVPTGNYHSNTPNHRAMAPPLGPVSLEQGVGSGSQGDPGEVTPHASLEYLPPPPAYLMNMNLQPIGQSLQEANEKRLSVAETIKSLTETNHQPVSPNMVRRSVSMRQTKEDDHLLPPPPKGVGGGIHQQWNPKPSKSGNGNATLIRESSVTGPQISSNNHGLPGLSDTFQNHPHQIYEQPYVRQNSLPTHPSFQQGPSSASNSPRTLRRFSEDLRASTNLLRKPGGSPPAGTIPHPSSSKDMFVRALNAKLAEMRSRSPQNERRPSIPLTKTSFVSKLASSVGHTSGSGGGKSGTGLGGQGHHGGSGSELSAASRVRQWLSSKTVPDPVSCRESLMDQIRRGTRLKPTRSVSDRSAPNIHY